ncbi:hypothetical protein N0V90_013122 [Kalmusia sp. IMI 367209]|nr:hypothetical protein N0V90_013122 [Kalmusia sp. IMI 367209]
MSGYIGYNGYSGQGPEFSPFNFNNPTSTGSYGTKPASARFNAPRRDFMDDPSFTFGTGIAGQYEYSARSLDPYPHAGTGPSHEGIGSRIGPPAGRASSENRPNLQTNTAQEPIPQHFSDASSSDQSVPSSPKNDDFIPVKARGGQAFKQTLDFNEARHMTSRHAVNFIPGPVACGLTPEELSLLQKDLPFDPKEMTTQQLANMGHAQLDALAELPAIKQVLSQFCYQPAVKAETLDIILPSVYKDLDAHPEVLEWYQTPEKKPEKIEDEEDDENGENADKKKKKKRKKPAPARASSEDGEGGEGDEDEDTETKYLPIKVHYGPYKYRFKTAEEARMHRKKIRHPAKRASDVERVKKYGRYYWTKRIYEAMINVDLVFDNRTSNIAARFTKNRHFSQDDLEATAHAIFDECIAVHERGWNNYEYHYKDPKRGKLVDTTAASLELRLERICGILKHNKASCNDCVDGGITLAQMCHNPIARADTKTANNKGNVKRALRLAKAKTDGQLAKEAEQEARKKRAAENKARKEAEKAAQEAAASSSGGA